MNVQHVLAKHRISTRSDLQLASELGQFVRNSAVPEIAASSLVSELLGRTVRFNEPVYAGVFVKALGLELRSVDFEVDDADAFIESATDYAVNFCNDPKWSFLFVQPEYDDRPKVAESAKVQVVEGIDIKVAVKADGSIKKGGKEPLAFALYEQHVVKAEVPLTNQQYIALIMKELDMTKAGATTYAYNARKHFSSSSHK